MPMMRLRIQTVMFWVAVVAFNMAVCRALYATRRIDLLGAGVMTLILLQVGAFRSAVKHGRKRWYWLGFVGGGAVAGLSYLSARSHPSSVFVPVWRTYLVALGSLLEDERTYKALAPVIGGIAAELIQVLGYAAVLFLPLALSAWLGGLLAREIYDRRPRDPHRAAVP